MPSHAHLLSHPLHVCTPRALSFVRRRAHRVRWNLHLRSHEPSPCMARKRWRANRRRPSRVAFARPSQRLAHCRAHTHFNARVNISFVVVVALLRCARAPCNASSSRARLPAPLRIESLADRLCPSSRPFPLSTRVFVSSLFIAHTSQLASNRHPCGVCRE
jgi:hypothetical protein